MRVGKKQNKTVEVRQTRSCVVRLEKVSTTSPNLSPSPEENRLQSRAAIHIISSTMAPTPKGRKGISLQREDKSNSATPKKKIVSESTNAYGSFQTPQTRKGANISMSNIKSNQKVKIIPKSNKPTPPSITPRVESPPPTIAAGRSRRAIKPNPKYASEDMVTPKAVRNVGLLNSSSRGSISGQNKTRKTSTSSEDFYNHNSEDDYDNYGNNDANDDNADEHNDKAYQASDKDDQDSDFSVIEEASKRISRPKGRPKKSHEPAQSLKSQIDNKLPTQTRSAASVTTNFSNLRSAPSQLQQIRRSLATASAQRNFNLLSASGTAQKRKLEESQDSSDNESNYSSKRKQLLLSNSSGHKVKIPVGENKTSSFTTPLTKSRIISQTQVHKTQTINGSNKINNVLASSRRAIEIAVKCNSETIGKSSLKQSANINQHNKSLHQNPITTQAKIFASKTQKLPSGSPKLALQKEKQNNGGVLSLSSSSSSSSSTLKTTNKIIEKAKSLNVHSNLKPKIAIPAQNLSAIHSDVVHEIKDDSPNSTMDDFETMPTFTIVNVNDIINKKGDVLITKSKSNSNKTPTVIELSESISLDDDDDEDNLNINNVEEDVESSVSVSTRQKQMLSKKLPKSTTPYHKNEIEHKKSPLNRPNDSSRKLLTQPPTKTSSTKQAPQILNHKLGLRNSRVTPKTTTRSATFTSPDKPAPRILNSVVAKKTQPVKPLIANMEDSADESFLLSLDEDEEDVAEQETEDEIENKNTKGSHFTSSSKKRNYQNLMEVDTEDTESQNTEESDTLLQHVNSTVNQVLGAQSTALEPKQNTSLQRRRRAIATSNTPIIISSNKKRLTPAAAKENSLAATNQQVNDMTTKQSMASTLLVRKSNTEKVVISKQGDKIIKKITCFETWYVINIPAEPKRSSVMKNQLEMPLIQLANQAKNICLPNNMWTCKVTLSALSTQSLVKSASATYTGDLQEHNINEEDREKYQPACVMFRRSIDKSQLTRMPYDRAVIFKNKTFYTNIEGKNIRLLGAPSVINCESEIAILLKIVDRLSLQSDFVELISVMQ